MKDVFIDMAWLHPQLPHPTQLDQGVGHETVRWTRKTLQVWGRLLELQCAFSWRRLIFIEHPKSDATCSLKIWTDTLKPSESTGFSVSWRYPRYWLMNLGRLTWSARIFGWDYVLKQLGSPFALADLNHQLLAGKKPDSPWVLDKNCGVSFFIFWIVALLCNPWWFLLCFCG